MATTVITSFPIGVKIKSWLLIVLAYLITFVTPMVAAYYLLAKDVMQEAGKGGLLYFLVIGVFGGGLIIAATKIINKQKSNVFKTIFRLGVKTLLLLSVLALVKYIDYNLQNLEYVLYIAFGGFAIGAIVEAIAVAKFTDYIREVGVF